MTPTPVTPPVPAPPSLRDTAAERGLAGLGYVLVVAALFTVWITGLFAWIMCWQHRNSPDPLARAHFRFQLWIADLAGVAVGIGAALLVSGVIMIGGPLWDGDALTGGDWAGAAGLSALGLVLLAVSFLGTIAGAAFGAWRLLQGRPPRGGSRDRAGAPS